MNRRQFLRTSGSLVAASAIAVNRPWRAMAGSSGSETLQLAWARPVDSVGWLELARFDLTHRGGGGGAEVLLWPGDESRLAAAGIPFEVTVDDLVGRDQALPRGPRPSGLAAQPGERDDYRTLADYEADLRDLARARPNLARTIVLPMKSLGGRSVLGIEISENVGAPDGRPTFYMDGVHHAREWPSGEMSMMFAHDLVTRFGSDPRITRLLRSCRVVVVPIVNPDGFAFSRGFAFDTSTFLSYPIQAVGFGSYWRKNRRTPSGRSDLFAAEGHAAFGVDPNRNYAKGWGGPGTRPVPLDMTYPGTAPFSEPESRNVGTTVLSRTVTGVISNHTYSDLVLRPWGDTRDHCPDEALLNGLGAAMAKKNGYRNIKGIELYPTTGTMSDWAYASVGALAYTFEHGKQNFHPPYAGFIPQTYARNRDAFLLLAEASADSAHHAVLVGRTTRGGAGVEAAVRVRRGVSHRTNGGAHDDKFEVAITSNRDGHFAIHLGPSAQPGLANPQPYEVLVGRTSVKVEAGRGQRVDLGRLPA